MLDLHDDRWLQLTGGHRRPFDARPALARLRAGDASAWDELWNGLYHQDDIGTASLAVVPHLVALLAARAVADWQTYAFVGSVELQRGVGRNPDLPAWLADSYHGAWRDVVPLAVRDLGASSDPLVTRAALGVVALARGLAQLGELALAFTADELDELLASHRSDRQ